MFICRQKKQLHPPLFSGNIPKILQTCYLRYFEHTWLRTPKMTLSTCRKLSRLSTSKKSTSSPTFFWRYWKDMQTVYFGYFGHAYLCTQKMIKSTCRTLRCLSACQKNLIVHFFLEILHFKESCNLIDRQHFGP